MLRNADSPFSRHGVEEALEEHDDVQLVLLDRFMPEMDGIEFLKNIRADVRFKDLPVVMETAATADDQVVEGNTYNIYYYLTKPYDKTILLSVVRSAVREIDVKGNVSI